MVLRNPGALLTYLKYYKESLCLFLYILATNNWKLQSSEITKSYLQSCITTRNHHILDAQQNQWWVCRCWLASIYITKCWTSKFRLGCIRLERSMQWQLPCGLLFAHADDFPVGGHFHEFILALKKTSTWNIWVLVSVTEAYRPIWKAIPIASLKLIRRTVEFTENAFWHKNFFQFRHVIGQVNWVATQARPDEAFDNFVQGNSTSQTTDVGLHRPHKGVVKIRR